MKCRVSWSFDRYCPPDCKCELIYISRVVPGIDSITLFWFGNNNATYTVYYREKGCDTDWNWKITNQTEIILEKLKKETDYEFRISGKNCCSEVGFARTGFVPGTVVNYLHPSDSKYAFSGQYLCTPSLLKHPDGYLLASMDVYGRRTPQNLTLIFRSDDGGTSWYHYSELFPCFWGKLFLHKGEVYMLATSTEYGDLLIGKSVDGGKNWLNPIVLLRGSCHSQFPGWHKSAMPIIEHRGRLWTGIDYGSWTTGGHASSLLSIALDADLLQAENWHITELVAYDPTWKGSVEGDTRGFLEGNAVALPDGGIANILRYTTDKGSPKYGLVPILRGSCEDPDQKLVFDRYVPFPGNLSKFDILFDDVSGCYYSIVCRIYDEQIPGARNLLSLIKSTDLEHWEIVTDLLDYTKEDHKTVGFQYVSFIFDGDDLLYLSRTAFNDAQSFHDNNFITFHRVSNFRKL